MSMEEFGRTTPGMFMALMKRQNVRFRHECYVGGIPASMVANVKRRKDDDKLWSPMDFVPSQEREKKRDKLKKEIMSIFGVMLEFNSSPDAMDDARERIVERLTEAGNDNVDEIFDEVFPHWETVKK
jgi:hypothetical protein